MWRKRKNQPYDRVETTVIPNPDGTESRIKTYVVTDEQLPSYLHGVANAFEAYVPTDVEHWRRTGELVVSAMAFPQEHDLPLDLSELPKSNLPDGWMDKIMLGEQVNPTSVD